MRLFVVSDEDYFSLQVRCFCSSVVIEVTFESGVSDRLLAIEMLPKGGEGPKRSKKFFLHTFLKSKIQAVYR